MMMDNMMMDGSMMAAMCMMMVFGLLLFVIIAGATVYVVARMLMKKSRLDDRPLMILKERFVKGELTDDEYTHMRKKIVEWK